MPHLIIKIGATLEVLFCALNEQQNVGQRADCVLVTADHHVCKSNVVASRNVTCWNLSVHWLQCKTNRPHHAASNTQLAINNIDVNTASTLPIVFSVSQSLPGPSSI